MAGFFVGLLPQCRDPAAAAWWPSSASGSGLPLTFGWLTGYSLVVPGRALVTGRAAGLDALTGCVLIGLGIRLAAEQR